MNTGNLRYEVRVNGRFVAVYHDGDRDLAIAYATQIGGKVVDMWRHA